MNHTEPGLLPDRVCVIGAAGGLGRGILDICRTEGIAFTAVVRSRPERITDVLEGSRVVVIDSLGDTDALADAFKGCDAVLTALGVTATTGDRPALLSANMNSFEQAMNEAGVDRIVLVNSIGARNLGRGKSIPFKLFSLFPGTGRQGINEMQAVLDAVHAGAFASLRWTLVRAAVNVNGKDEAPVASAEYDKKLNSFGAVSYRAMGRWMLDEAAACRFVRMAPSVSSRR